MKVMSVGEFKTRFSEVLKRVQAGEEIGIAFGKSKEVVARLVPRKPGKQVRRKIGILDAKAKLKFSKDFHITPEEFLGL